MPRKSNLRKAAGLAALAAAALSVPASVSANHAGEPCTAESVQFIKAYCAAYWQDPWQPDFASQAECEQYYMPACHNVYYYDGALEPEGPVAVRED